MRLSEPSVLKSRSRFHLKPQVIVGVTLALLGIASLVDSSLPNVDASLHLYYVPVLLAASTLSKRHALSIAALAIVLVHLADPELSRARYGEVDVMDLLLVLTTGVVVSRLTGDARALRRLAITDDLTGLHNLRSFESLSRALIERQRLSRGSVAMLSLDVDHLKRLNDTYGHLTGADAVKHVGSVIARVLPVDAHACRYGGDEFAIVMPEHDGEAAVWATLIQQALLASAPVLDNKPFPAGTLSVSIGHSSLVVDAQSATAALFTELFRRADDVLYANKRSRPPDRVRAETSLDRLVSGDSSRSDDASGIEKLASVGSAQLAPRP